jgi:type IV pilus assembly protein PilQ
MTPHMVFWTSLLVGVGLSGISPASSEVMDPGSDPTVEPAPAAVAAVAAFEGSAPAAEVAARSGFLTGLEIIPAGDRTEVVLGLEGEVETRDFTMEGPDRIVVDLLGARSELAAEAFRALDRGGIREIRATHVGEDVVRVTLEMEALVGYAVLSGPGYVRISLENLWDRFEPWRAEAPAPGPGFGPGNGNAEAVAAAGVPVGRSRAPSWAGVRSDDLSRRITVSFSETPLREVLFTFSEFSGRSIIPGAGITGNVSAEIRDQPWDIALQAILESQGLAAEEAASGIIRVDRLDELARRADVEPLVTRPFRIAFGQAQDFQDPIQTLLSGRGRISISRSTNTLVVTDIPRVLDQVEDLIAGIDIQTPEITISAKIIFVNRTDLEELGVVYDLKDSRGNQFGAAFPAVRALPDGDFETLPTGTNLVSLGGNSIAALGNANQRVVGPSLQFLTSLVLGRHTLLSFVEALASVNLSDIQAAPQIRVLENTQARILVGERTPILQQQVQTGEIFFQPPTIQFQETGIQLEVTPQVTTGDLIFMNIRAERSGVEFTPDVGVGLIFNTQEAETSVLVENGETIVIGGLTVTEVQELRAGIPLLKDLPLVGRFFRLTRESRNQRDLIILVTPEINRR